ncbi:MAG: hypothetical protein ACREQI_13575 [Candidatus Binataceae bacterium]
MPLRTAKVTILALAAALIFSACSPSAEYRYGDGFYSAQFSRQQVLDLQARGKVKKLAQFSTVTRSCLNYSAATTDRSMVIPAAQQGLRRWGGNAAGQISAREDPYDLAVSILLVPVGIVRLALAYRSLEVSEDVLQVAP